MREFQFGGFVPKRETLAFTRRIGAKGRRTSTRKDAMLAIEQLVVETTLR
jgi:hypothetical protein